MKKIIILFTTVLLTTLLVACSNNAKTLESIGLEGYSAKEILTGIADGTIKPHDYSVSVYDDELLLFVDEEEISLPMPEDEFYLSVAPYYDSTHQCYFHSATGCRGELKQETFFVKFITQDGDTILAKEMQSLSNGFIDLWLPRNIEGTLTISQGNFSVSQTISTYAGDKTCETTMMLQ